MSLARVALAVSTLVFAAALFAADPHLGAEQPLTPLTPGLAIEGKVNLQAASDGDGFLVVWTDLRSGVLSTWAQRLDRDGQPLDVRPLFIRTGSPKRLLWDGTAYVIQLLSDEIARVTASGQVSIHPFETDTLITSRSASGETLIFERPDPAALIVYFHDAAGHRTSALAVPVDASENVTDYRPLAGGDWALLTTSNWIRINQGGVVQKRRFAASGGRLSADGLSAAAIHIEYRYLGARPYYIYHHERRVEWATLDSRGFRTGLFDLYDFENDQLSMGGEPATAFAAGDDVFYFGYSHLDARTHDLRAQRVAGVADEPVVIDGERAFDIQFRGPPVFAASATRMLMVWRQPCGNDLPNCQIAVRVFERGASPDSGETRTIATETVARQDQPAAAAGAASTMVAWREYGPGLQVRARVTPNFGPAIDVAVSESYPHGTRVIENLQLAATDGGFAVAWTENAIEGFSQSRLRLVVRRFRADGSPIDAEPIQLARDWESVFSIAPLRSGFALTWTERSTLKVATMPLSGAARTTTVQFPTFPNNVRPSNPKVRRTGNETIVFWFETNFAASELPRLMSSRLSENGDLAPAVPVDQRLDSSALLFANDRELALVSETGRPDGCLRVTRFSPSLTNLGSRLILCDENVSLSWLSAQWDGEKWWVSWRRPLTNELRTLRVFDAGWSELARFDLDFLAPNARPPALLQTPSGPALVYERNGPDTAYVHHLFVRPLYEPARRRSVR